MKILETGEWGQLFVDNCIGDGIHMRTTGDLLKTLVSRIVRKNFAFYADYNTEYKQYNYPLRHNERVISAIFMSSISELTNLYLSEVLISRKSLNTKILPHKKGRMDCWVRYRHVDFCIELKQHYHFAGKKPRDALIKNWNDLIEQVKEAKSHIAIENDNKNTVGVGIFVVPCFEYPKKKEPIKFTGHSHIFCKLLMNLTQSPSGRRRGTRRMAIL